MTRKWKSLSCFRLFVTPWTIQSMELSRPEYWSGQPFPSPRGSPQLRDGTQISHIAGRLSAGWATREAQDTRVGSLSLLQRIFLSQVSNQGLLHCRRILYQLSYQGSPYYDKSCTLGGFPGSPVVKTWPSYAGGARLIPGCWELRSHMPHGQNTRT